MSFESDVERARFNMIEQQIRPWEVLDPAVLELLSRVRREDFVPPAYRALAFVDTEVPLATADGAHEVMLAPKVEARMLQELKVARHETVLEIGAGSGFMAALLALEARQVISLEINAELARRAADNLARAGIRNASVRHADGAAGLRGEAPFDVILLSGSVAAVPPALLDQLAIGGRLGAIVGQAPAMRAVRITRVDEHGFASVDLFDTVAPRLHGFEEPPRFQF